MPIGIGGALLGGAVLGGLSGIFGANKAAGAQRDAAQQSAEVQKYMFDQSQQMQSPWMQTGAGALAQLAGLYGLSPINYMNMQPMGGTAGVAPTQQGSSTGLGRRALMTPEVDPRIFPQAGSNYTMVNDGYLGVSPVDNTGSTSDVGQYAGATPAPAGGFAGAVPNQDAAMSAFYTSPGYQFRMEEGLKSLGGMASALGQRGHGATAEDVMRYSQGLASDEFNQYTNRLAALAGIGQTTASGMGNQALLTGRGIGDAYSQAGNARASGILGVTNSLGNAVNNAAWMYGMYGGGGGSPPPAGGGFSGNPWGGI